MFLQEPGRHSPLHFCVVSENGPSDIMPKCQATAFIRGRKSHLTVKTRKMAEGGAQNRNYWVKRPMLFRPSLFTPSFSTTALYRKLPGHSRDMAVSEFKAPELGVLAQVYNSLLLRVLKQLQQLASRTLRPDWAT